MPELPTGTVTFLFTDIEGSTRLLHELGERYAEVLAEHRRVLREAFAAHGGVEVDTQGDAFFVAFGRASDGVAAATEAQRALAAGPVRVRMGIHTGEPTRTEEGYVGMDVHRAARIAAAGHGGQVLVSQSTRDLLDGVELRDLGEHRLKDLAAPQRLFQLGEREFPPLKTLYQTNLPVVATPFLGREREVGEVFDLLREARLVTLTGPGGTGKTRLALQAAAEAAEEFEHGVFWVGLAPIRDPELVLPTIAQALGARDEVASQIGDKRMLVLVDNFEQVIEAAAALGELLAACPNFKLLVTTREPLHLEGEWEYAVQPMREADAVALFEQRARAVNSDFAANGEVTEICMRLDCLPLAVELAAARVKALSPAAILERLEQRLPLLTGGARNLPERQRTLRATIEWSYELLTLNEQQLFARLAAFAGGWTLEAAEQVCDGDLDTLQSLVDKSLIRHTNDRYWMLETLREFAAELLAASHAPDGLGRRHLEFFDRFSQQVGQEWSDHLQASTLDRMDQERENLRASFATARAFGEWEALARMAANVGALWFMRGPYNEGQEWFELALAHVPEGRPDLRAAVQARLADVVFLQGDWERCDRLHGEALAVFRETADWRRAAGSLMRLAQRAAMRGDSDGVAVYATEAVDLARRVGNQRLETTARATLGNLALEEGEYARARQVFASTAARRRELGDTGGLENDLSNLALAELLDGEHALAVTTAKEALPLLLRTGGPMPITHALEMLAALLTARGRYDVAAEVLASGEAMRREHAVQLQPLERDLHEKTVAAVDAALAHSAPLQQQPLSAEEAIARGLSALD